MKQWNRRGQKANSVLGRLPVCSLLSSIDEIHAGRHCTVNRAKIARPSEHEVTPRHLLLDCVPSRSARINDVASQRLHEMQEGDNAPFVRSRHVAMEVVMTCSQGQHSRVSRSASQESSPTRMRAGDNSRPTPNDISVAFCRTQLAAHELSAKYSLRGEEEAQYRWQMKRAR